MSKQDISCSVLGMTNDDVIKTSQIASRERKIPYLTNFRPFFGVFLPPMTWASHVYQIDFLLQDVAMHCFLNIFMIS